MGKVFQLIAISTITAATALAAFGQDLGSSNKLFGTEKKKVTPKRSAPKTTPRKTSSKKRSKQATASKRVPIKTAIGLPVIGTKSLKTQPVKRVDPAAAAEYEKLVNEADDAYRSGDRALAEASYRRAKLTGHNDPRADIGLGKTFFDQESWAAAETAYRDALKASKDDPKILLALSRVLVQPVAAADLVERYQEAEELARSSAKLSPQDAAAQTQIGAARAVRGLIDQETESYYRRAIEIDQTYTPAYAYLARLLRHRGEKIAAESFYSKAFALATTVPHMVRLPEILQTEQRFADSIPLLKRAAQLDSKNISVLLPLVRALIVIDDLTLSEMYLKDALSLCSECFAAGSLMAKLHIRQGRFAAAESALVRASKSVSDLEKPLVATQFEAIGDGYQREGNRQGAARAYKKALSFDSERSTISAKLAKLGRA
jgi:tetratricopeptide (TPR) repeat protein